MFRKFKLYQVKQGKKTRDYRFASFDFLEEFNLKVERENYDCVYIGGMPSRKDEESFLEELFTIFNINHPDYFVGRSMSVSDVVEIDGKFYYCDIMGFKEITF